MQARLVKIDGRINGLNSEIMTAQDFSQAMLIRLS